MTIDPSSLEPGEQLLWSDGPNFRAYCKRKSSNGFLGTRSGFAAGLAFAASGIALGAFEFAQNQTNSTFSVSLILFLIGAAMLYLPARIRRDAKRTSYALTDRRAIVETPGLLLRNRISVPYSEIESIEIQRGVSDDILFRDYAVQTENGYHTGRDGFLALTDAPKIERLLRSAAEKATGKPLTGGST
jgi:hypothetical protein